jgi:hypothetical protein
MPFRRSLSVAQAGFLLDHPIANDRHDLRPL